MGKRKFRRSSGGRISGAMNTRWLPFAAIVFGAVAMLICLIMYGIALDNLDTAYTAAATYTEQVGLTSVMGIWPLVMFVFFMMLGIGGLAAGSYTGTKAAMRGGWMDIFLGIVLGTVAIIIAVLMNTTIQAQLHTVYADAENVTKTVNIGSFAGLLNTMTVFGMVIFLCLMFAGLAPIAGSVYGGIQRVRGRA